MSRYWRGRRLLFFSAMISIAWGWWIQGTSPGGSADLKAYYYGSKCVIEHKDPYKEADFLDTYRDSGGVFPSDPKMRASLRQAVPICVNLPTTLFLVAPLTLLPWSLAHLLWFGLEATILVLAACLAVDMAGNRAPTVSKVFACLVLVNSEIPLASGNLAIVVASACVGAVWCIERGRSFWLGMCLLALALVLKPHDAGFIWLYLLILPGATRRLAVRSLALSLVVGVLSLVWITPASAYWVPELRSNLLLTSMRGGLNDPGPKSLTGGAPNMIIDLQSAISYFRDDPAFYNAVAYLVCGLLLSIWLIATIRARRHHEHRWFALSVVVPLSLLITYHRAYDAKLLLLTIPACAVLWAEGGMAKWLALFVNVATFLLCGDVTLALLLVVESKFHMANIALPGGLGTIFKILMERPVPVALLVMAIFYLVVYVRRVGAFSGAQSSEAAA